MTQRRLRSPKNALEGLAHRIARTPEDSLDDIAELAGSANFSAEQIERGRQQGFEGVGKIDARVIIRTLPIQQVRQLLPKGLELAPNPICFPDKHPVFFMCAHDFFEAWFGNMDYDEMTIGVPYVQLTDEHAPNRGPFIYMPRLYLNAEVPTVLGNHLYGYEKQMATIANNPSTYTIERKGEVVLKAAFTEAGPEGLPSALPRFEIVRQMFEQATVSQALRIVDEDAARDQGLWSPYLCSTVTYDLSDAMATVQPLDAVLQTTDALTPPGIPAGTTQRPSLATDDLGSFRLKCPVVVSLPGSCAATTYATSVPNRRQRVLVVGSGPSACAAAFYLAKQPTRYDVHLYTTGWRMGGKCAAGRNPDASNRIEEHGLHAFVGFYENGFRAMRDVYAAAGLNIAVGVEPYDYKKGEGPVANAFLGAERVGVMSKWKDQWKYFETPQRFNGKIPGQIPSEGKDPPPHFGHAVASALNRVYNDVSELTGRDGRADREMQEHFDRGKAHSHWREVIDEVKGFVDIETTSLQRSLQGLAKYFEDIAVDAIAEGIEEGHALFKGIAWLLGLVRGAIKVVFKKEIENEPEAWFIWTGLDTLLTAVIGLIETRTANFDKLDNWDFREWLLKNGLDTRNTNAANINQVYETLFAHGPDKPVPDQLACGVGLRWFMLVAFMYRGYPAYDFKYSCPQTMLSPYYMALKNLGATVHFFHRVEDIAVEGSGDERRLKSIRMQVQATVKDGKMYDPFMRDIPDNPLNQPAWPNRPNYDQLVEGKQLQNDGINLENVWSGWKGESLVLEQGRDFDICVLGTPVCVLPKIISDVTDPTSPSHAPAWAQMLNTTRVTRTISTQLWFRAPAKELENNDLGLLTCYAPPEPSFADFSHLLRWETWGKGPNRAQYLGYHTGSLVSVTPAAAYPTKSPNPDRVNLQWRIDFAGWLQENYQGLYNEVDSYEDLLDKLATTDPRLQGAERLDAQYYNVSVQPSDYYTLSAPKTMRQRLGQSGSWVQNLFLCGDWTTTDINCGSVEASTQSGMLASRVISNHPRYIWRTGF